MRSALAYFYCRLSPIIVPSRTVVSSSVFLARIPTAFALVYCSCIGSDWRPSLHFPGFPPHARVTSLPSLPPPTPRANGTLPDLAVLGRGSTGHSTVPRPRRSWHGATPAPAYLPRPFGLAACARHLPVRLLPAHPGLNSDSQSSPRPKIAATRSNHDITD